MSEGIIWLASYPKSGNTWLRAFLTNLLTRATVPYKINRLGDFSYSDSRAGLYEQASGHSIDDLTPEHLHRLRPLVHKLIANMRAGPVLVKTHNAIAVRDNVPTITPDLTLGAVYIIRNPLDVAISFAHHLDVDIDQAIEVMGSADGQTTSQGRVVSSYLGSWSSHVKSWATAPGLNAHVVRYEAMLDQPTRAFSAVAGHLGLSPTRMELRRAIEFSAFKELSSQEAQDGFRERSAAEIEFFRQGRSEQWRERLSPAQIDALVAVHGDVMEAYDYLP